MGIKAVLFDFDGTLADTLPLSFAAFRSVFLNYENRQMSNEDIIHTFGPTEEGIIKLHITDKKSVHAAIEHYYEVFEKDFENQVVQSPEMMDLLEQLAERGIKLGIITGKSRRCLDICSVKLGLEGKFELSITGDDVVKAKPDPEGILKAIRQMGLTKEEVIFVGDSNADMMAGKSAGVVTMGAQWFGTVQNQELSPAPDHVLTSTLELIKLVKTLRT
ncbi:HAD family hydrolase [Paenibacillus lutrae]|uniref:HAD-IA family hydrolase n=1 Tax=Paenibacillus lutrae TaxID=2078573 RepID=A0A7X3FEC6_9BACL|nr:HAD family hydrolase [Paenibacillus lutrae]MVO98079.1 HAD-IA family hydrolase [Paenibacillus lutrae]